MIEIPIWAALAAVTLAFLLGSFMAWAVFGSYGGGQSSGATRRDFAALLMLAVLVLLFVAYEMAGLLLPGWHTLSFLAAHNHLLAEGIGVLFVVGGLGGALWWRSHLRSNIPK